MADERKKAALLSLLKNMMGRSVFDEASEMEKSDVLKAFERMNAEEMRKFQDNSKFFFQGKDE